MDRRDARIKRKRRETELPVDPAPNETDSDVMFVAKVEPPEIKRNRLLKVIIGDYVQSSTRGAIQDILNNPAYFHSDRMLEGGDTCRILVPKHIDSYATYVVVLAALNPAMPLDCKSNLNGLTLRKLHDAAAFFKIDGRKIGLIPLRSADDSEVAAIQVNFAFRSDMGELWQLSFGEMLQVLRKDFLAVPSELDIYKAVKQWCECDSPARMTREILSALLAEIRWEFLVDILAGLVINANGPLQDALSELLRYVSPKPQRTVERRFRQRHLADSVFVFYADQNQAELNYYNWDAHVFEWNVPLPKEMNQWCKYKEMGPAIDGERVLLRAYSGKHLKTWSFSVVTKEVRFLFEQPAEHGVNYPLACINGVVYAWDFQTQGRNNCSFAFRLAQSKRISSPGQPKHFREDAAFETYNGKFYYCGGRSLAGGPGAVSTVEVFNAATNKWTKLPDMQVPRRCCAAKVSDGYLYVTGGAHDAGTGVLDSCERLNLGMPAAGWKLIGRLSEPRYGHCMFIINGQLCVCGGFTCRARNASPERYDLHRDRWEEVDVRMRWPITSCATFVVSYE